MAVPSLGDATDEVERALNGAGRQRRVVLAVPQFSTLPGWLAGSDLLAVVPDYVAAAMEGIAGVRVECAPLPLPVPQLSMAWRGVTHNDPRESWLGSFFCRYLGQSQAAVAALALV